jgi:hypothetical protein
MGTEAIFLERTNNMLATQLEASRRYQDRNREAINQASKERYAATKALPFAPPITVAKQRTAAFMDALKEVDDDLRQQIMDMIDRISEVFMERGNLKEYAARNQAAEFVASCVWTGVAVPRKHQPAARAVAGD